MGLDPESTAEALGSTAATLVDGEAFVFQEQSGPAALTAALLWARRRRALRLVLFCDEGGPVSARLARYFAFEVEVRMVQGASSSLARPEPLPVVLPGPDGTDGLLAELRSHGLEPVLEEGSWRGELLGLEVARLVVWPLETGGDGELHLEAGVGRFDRDAAAVMHQGEPPVEGLERAVGLVGRHRFAGAPPHALSRLARARWLRAVAIADPARVGATQLQAVQTSFPADNVREEAPAAALGTTPKGDPVLVVFATGASLELVPVAADTRALQAPGALLRLGVPARDRHPAIEALAALLVEPAEMVAVEPEWV